MPTYDYHCTSCDKRSEVFQKISDAPLTHCSACNQETLQRGIGGGSTLLRFEGSGFYITDYQRTTEKPAAQCGCNKQSCTK